MDTKRFLGKMYTLTVVYAGTLMRPEEFNRVLESPLPNPLDVLDGVRNQEGFEILDQYGRPYNPDTNISDLSSHQYFDGNIWTNPDGSVEFGNSSQF